MNLLSFLETPAESWALIESLQELLLNHLP